MLKGKYEVFPARAGMSRHYGRRNDYRRSVPRASGDEPRGSVSSAKTPACSPRERG